MQLLSMLQVSKLRTKITTGSSFCSLLRNSLKCRIEYSDNAQFNNLETLLVQNNVNIVYTFGIPEKGKLVSISKLLEQLNIDLKIVKKRYHIFTICSTSSFSQDNVEQDLSVLIGEDNLNLHPDILKMPLAMKAAGVLISVQVTNSLSLESQFVQWLSSGALRN